MYYRSNLSVITLRQILEELFLFVNLENRKYTVFCTFLLYALTHWAEILNMTLVWCTTEQVRVLSLCINFYTPVFRRVVLWYGDVRPSVRVSVCPTLRPTLRPSGSPSARFPHFTPTCFYILSWNFAFDFVLMFYRSSSSVVTLSQILKELCLFVNSEYRKCAVFHTFLLHALIYLAEILHVNLF